MRGGRSRQIRKRQRTAALHDAGAFTGAVGTCASFWTAPVLWRFGRGVREVGRLCDFGSVWVAQTKAAEDCRTPRRWRVH